MSFVESIVRNENLRQRLLFTLGILVVYRMGVHVPTPGVDNAAVQGFFGAQSQGLFGLFNTFTGGALEQFSVFALGIMPYISSSIIFQLLGASVPYLEQLRKEGPYGQKKFNQYIRYATVVLAIIQGYGVAAFLKNSTGLEGQPLVLSPMVGVIPFELMTIITLTAGTCFVMWLGEQITDRGIGNGASLIIFAGIAANIPSATMNTVALIQRGEMMPLVGVILMALIVVTLGFVIWMEVAQRRIPVQYSQRAGRLGSVPSSHLPLKVNFSGVIPPIFASSLLILPMTLTQFSSSEVLRTLSDFFAPSGALFNVLFVALIVFFCYFYVENMFKPNDVADDLKKHGGFVPGIRAGRSTAEYIKTVLDRITVLGAAYLSAVCVLPGILAAAFQVPFYFGGTSLLILIGVGLDFMQQVQSHLLSVKYESFMRGKKIKARRVQY